MSFSHKGGNVSVYVHFQVGKELFVVVALEHNTIQYVGGLIFSNLYYTPFVHFFKVTHPISE